MPILLHVGFLALLAELGSCYRACVACRAERISCLTSHGKQLPTLPVWPLWSRSCEQALWGFNQGSFSLHIVHRPGSSLAPLQKHSFCFTKRHCRSVFPLKAVVIVVLWVGWEEMWRPRQLAWTNRLSGPPTVPLLMARMRKKRQFRKTCLSLPDNWCPWQSVCLLFYFFQINIV